MKRILVIDDEHLIVDVIKTLLTDMGYEVVGRDSAAGGVEAAIQDDYDMVLCDLRMPEKSGADVTREILQERPRAKIVIMTADPTIAPAQQALDAGAAALIKKPFRMEDVVHLLDAPMVPAKDGGADSDFHSES